MKLTLTDAQVEEIALHWIKKQQDVVDGYKPILSVLFTGGQFAKWSWFDAIQFAVTKAGRAYHTPAQWIVDHLDRS
jgi:hypothetical protein